MPVRSYSVTRPARPCRINALAVAMPTPPAPTMPTRSPAMRARAYGVVPCTVRREGPGSVEVRVEVALVERVAEPTKRDADPGLGGAEGDLVPFGDLARAEAP